MTLAEMQALRDEQIKNELEAITKRIEAGTASYADAQRFSGTVGRVVGDIMSRAVCIIFPQGKADRKTIEAFLPPMLRDNYTLITSITTQVQEALNRKAGLRLKAAKPAYNKTRASGMVTELVRAEEAAEKAPVIAQQIENAARSIVDDAVKTNVAAHYRAGLRPKITRTAVGKCCQWCSDLAGVYRYPDDVPEGIYRRHTNCNCLVTYDPGNGARQQDVWSRKQLSDNREERIEQISQLAEQRKERDRARREALYAKLKR
jgi:hypothetical protein